MPAAPGSKQNLIEPSAMTRVEPETQEIIGPTNAQNPASAHLAAESQHNSESETMDPHPGSAVPQSGRKRAVSDPGDLKRPSTAGTENLSERQIPASQTMAEKTSAIGGKGTAAETSRMPYTGVITPLYLPPSIVPQPAVQMQPPLARVMPYQGFEYVPYADVSSLCISPGPVLMAIVLR